MPFVPYQTAAGVADRFLELLRQRNINPPQGGAAESELLSLTDLLEIWRDPDRTRDRHDAAHTIRNAAAIHDLAAKVLSAQALPDFSSFDEHLRLIAQAEEFTTIGQIAAADARDDISRKIAELYVGCLAIHCGTQVELDHPQHAAGDNPDLRRPQMGARRKDARFLAERPDHFRACYGRRSTDRPQQRCIRRSRDKRKERHQPRCLLGTRTAIRQPECCR
jgi:hypothetical protein